ncbi:MAG: Hpt domain-containing protein [Pseudomonadales bacterium]|nr:Hpt domain-containing protein [Pseudomonadales bacterium]
MASSRENFALDWIKPDLLETLDDARLALDDYAEQSGGEARLRACLTSLHQVHGTLLMLELKGVTLLADHLEQGVQALLDDAVVARNKCSETLMQGILELPGYLEELQRGGHDQETTFLPLVNEIRAYLAAEPIDDPAGRSLNAGASEATIDKFVRLKGSEKVARMRSVYQSVLLIILKGGGREEAVLTLKKIAAGLQRLTRGSALERQWQAFGEFVDSLGQQHGGLTVEAVKLLRRVDIELKGLALDGARALRRPANVELMDQLLDAGRELEYSSDVSEGLRQAVTRDTMNNTLAISGRQAMASAALVLREELTVIKDKLDLLTRAISIDLEALRALTEPLKQIGSTLSLLGFESSREIVSDQVVAIENLVILGDADPATVQSIAGALVQLDENLHSMSSERSEVEQITEEAQLQLLIESRKGLDRIKTAVVDFVGTHWDVRHLEVVPATFAEICNALEIIPLSRVVSVLKEISGYVEHKLMTGHRPDWEELDRFADTVSGVDYFLERLSDVNAAGAEDVLVAAERAILGLKQATAVDVSEIRSVEPIIVLDDLAFVSEAESVQSDADVPALENLEGLLDASIVQMDAEEISLELEQDEAFDLGAETYADIDGAVQDTEIEAQAEGGSEADAIAVDEAARGQVTNLDDLSEAGLESPEPALSVEPLVVATDVELPDPEIVEIFLEEVEEVLETIAIALPKWAESFADSDALAEVRRAFHTLKGSGRIVQAMAIGELSWGVENMLNRVIDQTVEVNTQFVAVIEQAYGFMPDLIESFKVGAAGDLDRVSMIVDAADVLASGGEIDLATIVAEETADSVSEAVVVDEILSETDHDSLRVNVAKFDDDAFEEASSEEPIAEKVLIEGLVEIDDLLVEVSEPTALEIFVEEAEEYLGVLAEELAHQPWRLSEAVTRAFHTLAGSASAAGCTEVSAVVDPANQVVEAWHDRETTDGLRAYLADTFDNLTRCLVALADGVPWQVPVSLLEQAEVLLSAAVETAEPSFLDAPEIDQLFNVEAIIAQPLENSAVLRNIFSGFVKVAKDSEHQALTDLGVALLHTLTRGSVSGFFDARRLVDGYELLIDQLNRMTTASISPDSERIAQFIEAAESVVVVPPSEADLDEQEKALRVDETEQVAEAVQNDLGETVTTVESAAAGLSLAALDIDEDLVTIFFEEAEEISEEVETNITDWSQEMENRLYMENLLRGLHTLKGGARLCGLMTLGNMAHDFESIVIEVQSDDRMVDSGLFGELHARYDAIVEHLAELKSALLATAVDDEKSEGVSEVVADEVGNDDVNKSFVFAEQADVLPLPSVEDLTLPREAEEVEQSDIDDEVEVAQALENAEIVPDRPIAKPVVRSLREPDKVEPEKVERPPTEMVRVGAALLEELVNLAGENSIVRARIEQGMSDFTGALDEMEITIERLREQLRRLEIETETQILFRHEHSDSPDYENFDPLEMDRYSQLQQLSRGLSESASDMLDLKDTLLFKARESETLLLQQGRINTELQEGLMRTRMVPFSRLLPRLRRIVRQVSGELSKDVEFHVQNAEGELDRNLLERMVPPLEHMLRNAIDHGIETVGMRRNFGKPGTGRIDLRLSREGGDVVIEISDDGAGIDVESVREKAVERGLTNASTMLSDDEALQFILAPGFSTAKSVTQISGRGVGMDVVHSEVKQLGGSISISSQSGQGSRFVLRVPFTVSVNRALMVSVIDDMYAIPLNNIEGIVLLNADEISRLHSSDDNTFEYAGVSYRVRHLGQYLGRDYRAPQVEQNSIPIVLVRSGEHAVAVHVDAVHGSREIVVKSLGPQFAGVGGISGATILGDGNVVVILDLLALIRAQRDLSARRTDSTSVGLGRPRCVLVVDDSVTVRKVTSRLLERQGMDVMVAKDGVEAVALLQEQRPDIMLLDIEMPRMDGFEVARQVRHDDRLENLPIVMISSRTGDKHKEHADQLGVNRFLGKPFQEHELLATIDELVTRF